MMNLSSDEDEDLSIPEQSESIPVAMPSGKPSRYFRYKIAETPMQLVDESAAVGAPSQPSGAVSNDSVANVHPRPEFDDILNDVTKQSMWSCFHDTFASFRDPLIDPESIMHPSRLYSFQIKALRRIQKALLGTLTPQEFEETKTTSKERSVIVDEAKRECGQRSEGGPTEMESPIVAQICQTVVRTPKNFRVRMPCGSGKTAICIWSALLFARNALIVTDSYENAVQTLKYIIKHTNTAAVFDVKFVCTDDTELKKDLSALPQTSSLGVKFTRTDRDIVPDEGNATRRHILDDGGTFGIVVMSSSLFKDHKRSADASVILRRTVFQSTFDLLVVDEADTTMANGVRHALEVGVLADSGVSDSAAHSSLKRRYTLRYKFGLFLSATWCRGVSDPRGAEYLLNIPQVVSMTAKEISDMGLIAKSYISIVVCEDTEQWIVDASKRRKKMQSSHLKDLMPSHMRAIESIVNMHAYYGHKIMIFTHYFAQFRTLERLFPNALTVTGEQNNRADRTKILDKMKTKTAYGEPFILIATNVCSTGLDIPDLNVVINAVNFGESDRSSAQRGGRTSRLANGKKDGFIYHTVAKGQHDWVAKIIDPDDPLQWSDVPRYSLLVADGYEESVRLWTDTEIMDCMQRCVLATAENKETATIHKAPLCYDRDDFKQIHILGFLRDQLGDKNVFPDCKSSEQSSSSLSAPKKRKPQPTPIERLSKAMKLNKGKGTMAFPSAILPARTSASAGKSKLPAIAHGSSSGTVDARSDRALVPEYFAGGFHSIAAQILGLAETVTDAQSIWTHMLEVEASVIQKAKERELERSQTRATLVLHNNIQGLCPFPSPPPCDA